MAELDLDKEVPALVFKMPGTKERVTIPEPSNKAYNRFTNRLSRGVEAIGITLKDRNDTEELMSVFGEMTEEQMDEMHEELVDNCAELCNGSPSKDQLESLSHRQFQRWFGWLQAELSNPEGRNTASRNLRAV